MCAETSGEYITSGGGVTCQFKNLNVQASSPQRPLNLPYRLTMPNSSPKSNYEWNSCGCSVFVLSVSHLPF